MTYVGNGEASAALLPHHQQGSVQVRAMRAVVLADVDLTGGRYSLYRLELAARGGGPKPHFHRTFSESFQILDGEVELYDGHDWVLGRPGDHLFIPEGGIHGFRNVSDEPATMLMMSVPGARREDYFGEQAEVFAAGRELSAEQWTDLYARHDQYMV